MTEKQNIIQLYLEGVSKRKIAKELKKSRNTVAKYIREFENSKQEWVYEEIYGANFSTLTKAMEEGSF